MDIVVKDGKGSDFERVFFEVGNHFSRRNIPDPNFSFFATRNQVFLKKGDETEKNNVSETDTMKELCRQVDR